MNKLDAKLKRILANPEQRRAWVKYQIQMQGRSMAQVASEAGIDRHTLYSVFMRPYPRMEKIVAEAVGYQPQQIFPERYDEFGLPNRPKGRPKKSASKPVKGSKSRRSSGTAKKACNGRGA